MKGIAFILALVIFSTSVKGSAFTLGVVGAVNGSTSTSSCCKKSDDSEVKKCDDSEEEQEESGCCEGDSCSCTCCLHIAYIQQFSINSNQLTDFSEVKFGYSFLYQASYLTSVFHPPALL